MTIPDNLLALVGTDTPLNLVMRVTSVTEDGEHLVLHTRVGIAGDPLSFEVLEYPVSEVRLTREAAEGGAGVLASVGEAMAADLLMGPYELAEAAKEAGTEAG